MPRRAARHPRRRRPASAPSPARRKLFQRHQYRSFLASTVKTMLLTKTRGSPLHHPAPIQRAASRAYLRVAGARMVDRAAQGPHRSPLHTRRPTTTPAAGSSGALSVSGLSLRGLLDRRQRGGDATLRGCAPIIDLRIGLRAEALAETGDACGQELPRLGEPGAAISGSNVYPQRTQPLLTSHANSRPGSAATTRQRVSHVRSGSSLRPVNHAPTAWAVSLVPPAGPADRAPARPSCVTSDTSAYSSSGVIATEIESDIFSSVTTSSDVIHRLLQLSAQDVRLNAF